MRLYSVPDIHGRKDLLVQLLEKLITEEQLDLTQDKIVFTGDYIDRGKDSKGVLDTLIKLREDHPNNVVCLLGNHEEFAVKFYTRGKQYDDFYLWSINGGDKTIESYLPLREMSQDHVEWLAKLPLSHEEPGFFFSHAPVPRDSYRPVYRRGQPYTKEELIWTYHQDEFGVANNFKDKVGVCGHIHALRHGVMTPRFYDHYIFADAGCGCSDKAPLVAIEVNTRKVIYSTPQELEKK